MKTYYVINVCQETEWDNSKLTVFCFNDKSKMYDFIDVCLSQGGTTVQVRIAPPLEKE